MRSPQTGNRANVRAWWADPARPPTKTVPYIVAALAAITRNDWFSVDAW